MNTYQICVEYLGTNFVGWQLQKNGLSIQEVLEKVISNFLRNKTRITGSGRTDAGVHANEQSVHFKTKNVISNRKKFLDSINFFLKDYPISVLSIKKRPKNFHARHSAKERTYKSFLPLARSAQAGALCPYLSLRLRLTLAVVAAPAQLR